MGNYLKMQKRQQVIALLELGWTYWRIEAETGVRRETVSPSCGSRKPFLYLPFLQRDRSRNGGHFNQFREENRDGSIWTLQGTI